MVTVKFNDRVVTCKGIIFDKDCTLTDSFAFWPELIANRAERLVAELQLPGEAFASICRVMGFNPGTGDVNRKGPVVVGSRLETAAAVTGILFYDYELPWDQTLQKVTACFDTSDRELGLEKQAVSFPNLPEKLYRLYEAGCILAVATNDSTGRTEEILRILGVRDWFTSIACADRVATAKPSPDLVRLICEETKLTPSDFIVIGDSLLDIRMGVAAGVKCNVGVLTGAATAEELEGIADIIISSVTDLEILEEGELGGKVRSFAEDRTSRCCGCGEGE